jgi:hypothetical protein
MHLTIVYRDILCDVGKGWFSTRLASEKPALLASYSFGKLLLLRQGQKRTALYNLI